MHATLYSGPRQTLADLTKSIRLYWLPIPLTPSPSASKRHNGAVSSFGEYGLSCGLHVSLCTLQLTCSVYTSAVAVATLGRSGWLILSPQGLPPCKKRQASLGALTELRLSRRAGACLTCEARPVCSV